MINHVRVILRRADRRLMGGAGQSKTLCGGAMTDRDLLPRDARKDMTLGWQFLACEKCRSMVEASARNGGVK